MDWLTLKTEIIRELHQDATSVPSSVSADVQRAICDSIRYNRRYGLIFNVRKGKIYTVADEYKYSLPTGFMAMVGEVFFTPAAGDVDTSGRIPMREMGLDLVEEIRYPRADYDNSEITGTPQWYGIDQNENALVVSPKPSVTGNIIEFRYIADLGTPAYRYTGSAWSFYVQDTMEAIDDNFTNAWFTEGAELIKSRALATLWSGIYGGTQEAAAKTQAYLQRWAEELVRMRAESAKRASKRNVRRHI